MRKPMLRTKLRELERDARWEGEVDAVLAGTLVPQSGEYPHIARYCGFFEKKYARAARFGDKVLSSQAHFKAWVDVSHFAGWAVQAAVGNGADAAELTDADRTELRRNALTWLRESVRSAAPNLAPFARAHMRQYANLRPMRDPKELAKLPPDERTAWEAFWAEIGPELRPVAPPPREVKP
jgi:hypothetical protein